MFKTDGEPGRDKLDLQFLMENLDSRQFQLVLASCINLISFDKINESFH